MIFDLDDAVATLSARNIRAGQQSLPDGGVLVWLGDLDGRKAETTLPPQSIGSAGAWLMQAARRVYPDHFLESAT